MISKETVTVALNDLLLEAMSAVHFQNVSKSHLPCPDLAPAMLVGILKGDK